MGDDAELTCKRFEMRAKGGATSTMEGNTMLENYFDACYFELVFHEIPNRRIILYVHLFVIMTRKGEKRHRPIHRRCCQGIVEVDTVDI